ncbi:MAG TPA: hypothetical protein VGP06_19215 [Janthinobacterium sp.]|nr:hypothetical protein [Janthinobacterium sp.]
MLRQDDGPAIQCEPYYRSFFAHLNALYQTRSFTIARTETKTSSLIVLAAWFFLMLVAYRGCSVILFALIGILTVPVFAWRSVVSKFGEGSKPTAGPGGVCGDCGVLRDRDCAKSRFKNRRFKISILRPPSAP